MKEKKEKKDNPAGGLRGAQQGASTVNPHMERAGSELGLVAHLDPLRPDIRLLVSYFSFAPS